MPPQPLFPQDVSPQPVFPQPGLSAAVDSVVGPADTAAAVGSGDVPVLATPRALALLEAATVAAVGPALPPGSTSVGTRVELDHLRPTPVGVVVTAHAALSAVEGRRLVFAVRLTEGGPDGPEAARGVVVRAVVDRERFAAGARPA